MTIMIVKKRDNKLMDWWWKSVNLGNNHQFKNVINHDETTQRWWNLFFYFVGSPRKGEFLFHISDKLSDGFQGKER